MPATPAWLAPVESVLNRNIAARARAAALLRRLDGRSLQLQLTGMLRVRVLAQGGRLALLSGDDTAADAEICGSAGALLGMMAGTQPPAASAGNVQVRGDAEVASLYRELLSLARPDPEEEAARLIGDVAAHRLGNFVRGARGWLKGARDSAVANVAEYLTEEGRDVVNGTELDEYLRGVDAARESADRLEARLRRLERRSPGAG